MDFELSDEQSLLRDSLRRLFGSQYAFEQRRTRLDRPFGHDPAFWQLLAAQGVLGAGLPAAQGGFGGAVEIMIVMEEIGRCLLLEPFLSTVVACGGLLRDVGSELQREQYLTRIVAGEIRGALAHHERGARFRLGHVESTARRNAGGFVLSGSKASIEDGAIADLLILSARDAANGAPSLFLVQADAPGIEWARYRTHDGRGAADIVFRDLQVSGSSLFGEPGGAVDAIAATADHCIAALCAEAVGAMEALNDATLGYLKSRRQFGQPIGRFQVLQHRMADMFLLAAQARSMSYLASGRCADADPGARRRASSAAKAFIGKAGRFIGQQAVQLNGGMGLTAELAVSHYFKRLTLINSSWGDEDHHVGLLSELIAAEVR